MNRPGECMCNMFVWCIFALIVTVPICTEASRIRHYRWNVKYEYKSPDCYEKLVITINGEFPGPTILAQEGDLIYVELTNLLPTENVAIHWHGIRQIGTPWSDGAEAITQCPILPGQTFVYKFTVDRPGTYLYHAHYGMQRSAGLYGSIHVAVGKRKQEPFSYDGELSVILNDWWHKSHQEQAHGLSTIPFIWVGEPESLLIGARGSYNCSLLKSISNAAGSGSICNSTNPQCSTPHILSVKPGKTYRLRITSVASLSSFNFLIEGHNMTVVEADGHYVEPFVVQDLNIYSGETYSVLIRADQDPSRNYWAALNVRGRQPKTPTGRAILNYIPNSATKFPPNIPPTGPLWNDSSYTLNQAKLYKAKAGYVDPPPLQSSRRIILLNTQNKIDGYTKWAINNISFVPPQTPYLIALKHNLSKSFDQIPAPENYLPYDILSPQKNQNTTYGNRIYKLQFNSTVDVILQNANMLANNASEIHPWHLHGHDFWVLAHGEGAFDPLKDTEKFNLKNPPLKNTVPLLRYGWTAIRFRADNPGAWQFHCHVEAHFFMGMGVVFSEGVERISRLPTSIMGCGESKRFFRH
ncbi:hypothetical protein SUGI_1088640 [Cryptomeria japonica]|uniref:L-ascorbate oxidase n=1 Tax=Cryptomeria japonica TaxID=3369 RepID=UPI00241497E9|nr:L-ascorbate oxidase [Cryptomeria japonica]GLJ51144.1 hypothetical protein SUGI_1088640 [Cryptomeria japonica]